MFLIDLLLSLDDLTFVIVGLFFLYCAVWPAIELVSLILAIFEALGTALVDLIARGIMFVVRWAFSSKEPSPATVPGAAAAMPQYPLAAPPPELSEPPVKAKKRTHPPRPHRAVRHYKGRLPLEHGARFYLDECVAPKVAERLRRHGLDVLTIRESGLMSRSDEEQLLWAACKRRVLITHDKDFRTLHERGELHAGIIHLPSRGKHHIQELVRRCLLIHAEHEVARP